MSGVVVVGAGQGGFQVAASLRDGGYSGPVTLIGDEPGLPYGRPPLSKAYLSGASDREALQLRSAAYFAERGVDVLTPERVVEVDRASRRARLASGRELAYEHLVLATGSRNRFLPVPGAELEGVLQLRTLADADAIKGRLAGLGRVAVVGAGFIGLEFAAVAAARGIDVTVFEATGRPMSRAVSLPTSTFYQNAHEQAGVRFELGAVVTRIAGEGGRAVAVETATGGSSPADLVVVGIGVVPNLELAAEAGLPVANGIVVDERLQTADPAVSAIGDCASFPSRYAGGERVRLESVQNAVDQAKAVAARIAGAPAPYDAVPWFWSDQGANKLQIAGLPVPHATAVVRGDPASGGFSVFCYEEDRLVSVESVNRPADHMIARRLIAKGAFLPPEEAADPGLDLKARASDLLAA